VTNNKILLHIVELPLSALRCKNYRSFVVLDSSRDPKLFPTLVSCRPDDLVDKVLRFL